MTIIGIETEVTTAVTDLILAFLCIWAIIKLSGSEGSKNPEEAQRILVWKWAFGFLFLAATLGFVAHGFEMSDRVKDLLWEPLYLSLGWTVSLFVVGVLIDARHKVATWVIWGMLALGFVFYGLTKIAPGGFLVFILYEGVAMLFALGAYIALWLKKKQPYMLWMIFGIAVTIGAAVIQASGPWEIRLIWLFDHNGIFHLVQMVGVVLLVLGLLPSRSVGESE